MESFIFAVNAVMPIVLMVAAGYVIKRLGIIDEKIASGINKVVFRLLIPCMLFLSVYGINDIATIAPGYMIYAVLASTVVFFCTAFASRLVTSDGAQRGVLVQSSFRSNYALVGIPLATSLFGAEGTMVATVLSAVSIPIFNVLAVISLTAFTSSGKPDFKKIINGIFKNPLIISIFSGFAVLLIRFAFTKLGIGFRLTDIAPLYSALEQLSKASTPVALLALGAQFEFSVVGALKKQIIFGTLVRTVIVPAVALTIAYLMGCFSGAHFAAFVALFATPVAVSSVPMTQEMGGDTTLVGQLVVWTTLISGFTIFMFSFILKSVGIF